MPIQGVILEQSTAFEPSARLLQSAQSSTRGALDDEGLRTHAYLFYQRIVFETLLMTEIPREIPDGKAPSVPPG